jgi:hypothetical protein
MAVTELMDAGVLPVKEVRESCDEGDHHGQRDTGADHWNQTAS